MLAIALFISSTMKNEKKICFFKLYRIRNVQERFDRKISTKNGVSSTAYFVNGMSKSEGKTGVLLSDSSIEK